MNLLFSLQSLFELSVLFGFSALNEAQETYGHNVMSCRKSQTEDVTLHVESQYLACLLHPGLYLNAELNPICHLPALLGAHSILQVSR